MRGVQVHIGQDAARTLLEALERPAVSALLTGVEIRARDSDLRPALGTSDKRTALKAQRAKAVKEKRTVKAADTSAIWEACWTRCGGVCECGCGQPVVRAEAPGARDAVAQLDHMFGRGKGRPLQSVETCWILRRDGDYALDKP